MSQDDSRLKALDGLRGIAILLVILFHYFSRWASDGLYPYGTRFADVQPAASGFVGVYLFFIISGCVIARSLGSSRSFIHFAAKRANRLVLPMFVISTVSFVLLAGPLATEAFQVEWSSFLPSWTFTAPVIWRFIDPNVDYIDGAYWTLFTEVRFYFIFSSLWFLFGQSAATRIFSLVAILAPLAFLALDGTLFSSLLSLLLFPEYAPLFACGTLYSGLMAGSLKHQDIVLLSILVPISCWTPSLAIDVTSMLPIVMWCVAFHLIFLSLAGRSPWVRIFELRPIVWLGLISYSLYLLHQNVGVALISRIPTGYPLIWQLLGVAVVVTVMTLLAALSWRLIERRRIFTSVLARLSSPAGPLARSD